MNARTNISITLATAALIAGMGPASNMFIVKYDNDGMQPKLRRTAKSKADLTQGPPHPTTRQQRRALERKAGKLARTSR